MLADVLADRFDGRRLVALVSIGVALEAVVMLLSRLVGSSGLIGIHAVIAIAIAGGIGAVLFVVLIGYAQTRDPHLYGLPVVLLWCGLPIGAGVAADSLRR